MMISKIYSTMPLRASMLSRVPALRGPIRGAIRSSVRTQARRSVYTLPDLPYDYAALEPYISAEIMEIHHSKHHGTYVKNLNATLEKKADLEAKNDLEGVIALQSALQFNGGGHINHSIFWKNLCPNSVSGVSVETGMMSFLV